MDNKVRATRNRNVYAFFYVQYRKIWYNQWKRMIMKKVMR